MAKRDFTFRNEVSLIMLYPQNKRAENWVRENIVLDTWQNIHAVAIEPRYFGEILHGITYSGLGIDQVN